MEMTIDKDTIDTIIKVVYDNIYTLSMQKVSSNVVERCLESANKVSIENYISK